MYMHFPEAKSMSFITFSEGSVIDERLRITVSETVTKVPFFVLSRILTWFLVCVGEHVFGFSIFWDQIVSLVFLYRDVFLCGEPVRGCKISGDSILSYNLFRSCRKLCCWSSMVIFCQDNVRLRRDFEEKKKRGKLGSKDAQSLLYLFFNTPEVIKFLLVVC